MLSISKNLWEGYILDTWKMKSIHISHSLLEACTALDLLEAWTPQESPNLFQGSHISSTRIFSLFSKQWTNQLLQWTRLQISWQHNLQPQITSTAILSTEWGWKIMTVISLKTVNTCICRKEINSNCPEKYNFDVF